MEENQNGPTSSDEFSIRLQGRLEQMDALLSKYEQSLGLPQNLVSESPQHLLTASLRDIQRMSAVELGESAFNLGQFAIQLQRAINTEQGKLEFLEATLKKNMAGEVVKAAGGSADERKYFALSKNLKAQETEKLRLACQSRLTRLAYLVPRVDFLARTLLELQQTKRRHRDD